MLKISCKIEVQVDVRLGLWHNYTSAEIHFKTQENHGNTNTEASLLKTTVREFKSVQSGLGRPSRPVRTYSYVGSKWALCIVGLTITRLATENQRLKDKLLDYDLNNQRIREDLETKIEDLTADILTQEDELIVRDPRTHWHTHWHTYWLVDPG